MQRWQTIMGSITLGAALIGATGAHAQESGQNDFSYWDTDGSGEISQEEWDGGMANIRTGMQADQPQTGREEGEENAIYSTYRDYNETDLNDDNAIDEQEFEQFRQDMQDQE